MGRISCRRISIRWTRSHAMSLESRTIAEDAPSRRPDERAPGGASAAGAPESAPVAARRDDAVSELARDGNGCKIVEIAGRLDHDRLRRAIVAAQAGAS